MVTTTQRSRARHSSRGGTLVEVLIAMAILAMLMVGVLQLFSLALVTDSGSAARTDMTLRAQQVAENLRYLHFIRASGATLPSGAGIPTTITSTTTVDLPYKTGQTGWDYWGPTGAGVFEESEPPYRISYRYSRPTPNTTPNFWYVTISVVSAPPTAASQSYVGSGAKVKRVDYVCQVHQ